MTKYLLAFLFFTVLQSPALAEGNVKQNNSSFSYELFEGEYGTHGYQAGLLITEEKIPPWLAEEAAPGDLVIKISYGEWGKHSVGPTFNAKKLEKFLNEAPNGESLEISILKKDKGPTLAVRPAPSSPNGEVDAGTAAAAIIGGIVVLGIVGEANKRAEYIKRGCREETRTESKVHDMNVISMVCPPGTREILGSCEKNVWVCGDEK